MLFEMFFHILFAKYCLFLHFLSWLITWIILISLVLSIDCFVRFLIELGFRYSIVLDCNSYYLLKVRSRKFKRVKIQLQSIWTKENFLMGFIIRHFIYTRSIIIKKQFMRERVIGQKKKKLSMESFWKYLGINLKTDKILF